MLIQLLSTSTSQTGDGENSRGHSFFWIEFRKNLEIFRKFSIWMLAEINQMQQKWINNLREFRTWKPEKTTITRTKARKLIALIYYVMKQPSIIHTQKSAITVRYGGKLKYILLLDWRHSAKRSTPKKTFLPLSARSINDMMTENTKYITKKTQG